MQALRDAGEAALKSGDGAVEIAATGVTLSNKGNKVAVGLTTVELTGVTDVKINGLRIQLG